MSLSDIEQMNLAGDAIAGFFAVCSSPKGLLLPMGSTQGLATG